MFLRSDKEQEPVGGGMHCTYIIPQHYPPHFGTLLISALGAHCTPLETAKGNLSVVNAREFCAISSLFVYVRRYHKNAAEFYECMSSSYFEQDINYILSKLLIPR